MSLTEEDVLSALKQCHDPEIPVNIVDLGLIYRIRFDSAPDKRQDVSVEMTLTARQAVPPRFRSAIGQKPVSNNFPAFAMRP